MEKNFLLNSKKILVRVNFEWYSARGVYLLSGYGEVDSVEYLVGAGSVYAWGVERDNAGRITRKIENLGTDTIIWDYTYDPMGRLATVFKDGSLVEEYTYDPQGNRLTEINTLKGISRSYTHDEEDKILYAGDDSYQFDLDGFLTSRTISSGLYSGTATFDYSSRGELLSVNLPTGDTITYSHDPMGRRVGKAINGTVTEKYLWQDSTTLLGVYDGSDTLLQRFEYADGRMPVAMAQAGQIYYMAYDQVGSLRLVTDSAGNIVKKIDYDSFGNILSDSNPYFEVPFGFAGGLHDRSTGLVRFGARDYDTATGKWTAKDPIDFGGGDLNLLSYVFQSPGNWVDSGGLQPIIHPDDMWDYQTLYYFGFSGTLFGATGNIQIYPQFRYYPTLNVGTIVGGSFDFALFDEYGPNEIAAGIGKHLGAGLTFCDEKIEGATIHIGGAIGTPVAIIGEPDGYEFDPEVIGP